jgi:hypothetical protein
VTDTLRVILELGKKRKVVAGAMDWPGLDRWARTWPIQFLVRRTAHHVMDHAWEMEDRDPGS